MVPALQSLLGHHIQALVFDLEPTGPVREHLTISEPIQKVSTRRQKTKTLADSLAGHIGIIDSSEFVKGGAQMSKNISPKLTKILLEKQRQSSLMAKSVAGKVGSPKNNTV